MSMAVACADDSDHDRRLSPLRRADEVPEVGPEGAGRAPARPRRVLVTDDNLGMRQTLSEILSQEGYVVQQAVNGLAALAALESAPVDVLILDLAMPLMDGVELLHQVELPPPVVIVHSAFAYYNLDEVRRQVGAKVFRLLKKPLNPSQLVSAVAEAIAELGDE